MGKKYEVNSSEPLIRIGEVARMAGVGTFAVLLWMKKGLFKPAYEIKRPDGKVQHYFSVSELQQFLAEREFKKLNRKKITGVKLFVKKYGLESLTGMEVTKPCEY